MSNLKRIRPDAGIRKNFHPTYDIFASTVDWTRDRARKSLDLTDEPIVLYFGAVRPYKGLKWLVEASPAIIDKIPGCRIYCVGDYWDGPAEFENQAKSLGTLFDETHPDKGGVMIVSGYIPNEEVGMYFAATDLVVLPYESATQSGIVQIAYGFKKPCVVTDVGGLPEVVLDGKTGYVIPAKDPDAIAEKTIEFFNDKENLTRKFEMEISEWRTVFDWSHMVKTIVFLINDLN